MVDPQNSQKSPSLSDLAEEILPYISPIGCGLSLCALVITVLIFITNKQIRADDSKKVHISFITALILLNTHFLLTHKMTAKSSTSLCFYMALSLHYSLLATFSWMALEGLHLYLLLVRVFNTFSRRYMLILSAVGWGVPAVVVSVVVILDRVILDTGVYGRVALDLSKCNTTEICYIMNDTVKWATTVGGFGLVVLFNAIMFVGSAIRVLCGESGKQFDQRGRRRARQSVCTMLSIMALLGATWGLVFFSFGLFTTIFVFVFSALNSVQGFFILLHFVLSWKRESAALMDTRR